jgi:hypothetical protein
LNGALSCGAFKFPSHLRTPVGAVPGTPGIDRFIYWLLAFMHSHPSNDELSMSWRYGWLGRLRGRLFAIGWAAAVVVATAGWFYFIFRIAWDHIGPLLQ